MTKDLDTLDFFESSSNDSHSSSENFMIGEAIVKEEARLTIENELADKEELAKYSGEPLLEEIKENVTTEEALAKKREAVIRENRYKRLMHLLNSSKTYSVILKERIQQEEATAKRREAKANLQNRKNLNLSKKDSEMDYNMGEILSKENFNGNVLEMSDGNPDPETEDVDYFKETRVTELGFTVSNKQPLLLEGAVMRDYQLKGLDWMKNLFKNGVNGILGDEMGLGKTIQVIAFICYLIEENIKGPFLIVAPLSTVSNWMNEFKRFAPKVPTMLYHGTKDERSYLRTKILNKAVVTNKLVHRVIITSYQVPLQDKAELGKINWYYLIIDEGHRIKNHNSLLSRTLREFNTIGRLLLTGTPLQNDLSELWSLLNFLLPEVFNNLDVFESWFDIKELESNGTKFMQEKFNLDVVTILQEILVPFLLRREKKDVNLQLPPKKEILIYCPITPYQKELYEAVINRRIESLLEKEKEEFDLGEPLPKRKCFLRSPYGNKAEQKSVQRKPREVKDEGKERFLTRLVLQNPQAVLRHIVNHPYLIQFPLKTGTEELRVDEDMVKQSGKLLVLDALLSKLKARGHKVIVFSYFKMLLDILEEHAIMRGYKYCRLDGGLKINDREKEILDFNSDPDIFVFYVSIRAGGLGINLTAADTVIFYDTDWNPQANLQSQDRCHRIGQKKPVVVYTLCAKGTIDERILERGNAKRRLEKMILQKGKYTLDSKGPKTLNLMDFQELKKLMESTNRDIIINSNGYVFTDEEFEALLDRSDLTENKLPQENKDNKIFKVLKHEL